MVRHTTMNKFEVRRNIRKRTFSLAGNRLLKIYGLLHCKSGKRMREENRIFFYSEKQALENGYRPCGHCMPIAYKKWKDGII
jgi:methylphosphotriester-DNA--protein-cysteine methyltransferase